MANLAYREVYTMNPTETRKLLINAYHETKRISKTARMWKTSRNVIRKWVRPPGAEGPPCEAEAPLGRSLAWRVEALIRPSFSSKVRTPPVHRERPGEWPSKPGWA